MSLSIPEHNEGRCECYVLTKWTITYYNVESKIFMRSQTAQQGRYRHKLARDIPPVLKVLDDSACSFHGGAASSSRQAPEHLHSRYNCGLFEFQRKGSGDPGS